MTRSAVIALLAFVIAACTTLPSAPSSVFLSDDARVHPERYVVVTVQNTPATVNPYAASTPRGYGGGGLYRASSEAVARANDLAAAHGLSAVAAWPIELLSVHCLVYRIPGGTEREAVLTALRRDARVVTAEPLSVYGLHAAAYNDPYAGLQQNLVYMDIPAAQRWTHGEGIRIAIIDTGIDAHHPDLAKRLVIGGDFVGDGRPLAEGHGTAVAGIIAAVPNNGIGIAGIAPDADLISLRACWSTGHLTEGACNSFSLAQALDAALRSNAAIVNLSLGGPNDALLERLVRRGLERGTVFVAAVPVSGRRDGFPTSIDGVIAVDASERTERVPRVLYAPGKDVFTLAPDGHYDAASGSSVAAAEVSGIAALLMGRRGKLQAKEVETFLSGSMRPGNSTGRGPITVNACVAMSALMRPDECRGDTDVARTH